jgi:hypothetical protein
VVSNTKLVRERYNVCRCNNVCLVTTRQRCNLWTWYGLHSNGFKAILKILQSTSPFPALLFISSTRNFCAFLWRSLIAGVFIYLFFFPSTPSVHLLHLAVSCHRLNLIPVLLPHFVGKDLRNSTMVNGMNALDIALQSVDPTIAFALVSAGCEPAMCGENSPNVATSTKVLLYKG